MKEIELTRGKAALVDDEWFERLNQYKWYAWTDGYNWYAVRTKKGIRMHRVIMGALKGQQIDHINHNGLDNRCTNLRFCTHSQNSCNSRKSEVATTSRFKGVSWDKASKKWRVQIRHNGKVIYLGMFHDEVESAHVYNNAATRWHGEFACLNQLAGES